MVRETEPVRSDRRRNVLRLLGTAGGLGLLGSRGRAQERDDGGESDDGDEDGSQGSDEAVDEADGRPRFHLEQGDECVPIAPLSGEQSVEALYRYAYPRGEFEGPPGVSGRTYSSEGTVDLQRENTSIAFLYDGPEGLSLVFVHGRADETEGERPAGESNAGGTVSFVVRGLPDGGEWVVLDDYYAADGEQSPSNYDRYEADDGYVLHWAFRGGRTDGGVFRGLDEDADVVVVPAFNDPAGLAPDHDYGTIEEWQVLFGDLTDPERQSLALDQPIRIAGGACPE